MYLQRKQKSKAFKFPHKHKTDNNANIGTRGFITWKQKNTVRKMLTPMKIEPGPLIDLWFQVPHSPF